MITSASVILSDKKWTRSEFPHPLVTLALDDEGKLIKVVVTANIQKVETDD